MSTKRDLAKGHETEIWSVTGIKSLLSVVNLSILTLDRHPNRAFVYLQRCTSYKTSFEKKLS